MHLIEAITAAGGVSAYEALRIDEMEQYLREVQIPQFFDMHEDFIPVHMPSFYAVAARPSISQGVRHLLTIPISFEMFFLVKC